LLKLTVNNATIARNWKRAAVIPTNKGGVRSVVTNYRPVSFTSLVCKQEERTMARYPRQVWVRNTWFYEEQFGFRPEYSCDSHIVTVWKDIADSLD